MDFKELAAKLHLRRVTEQSIVGIPGTTQDLDTVFRHFLNPENIQPLAKLDNRKIGLCNLLRAVSYQDENGKPRRRDDLQGFARDLFEGYLILSVTEKGYRSQQLTLVASGFMAAMKDIQKIEAAGMGGKSDLEKRGLI